MLISKMVNCPETPQTYWRMSTFGDRLVGTWGIQQAFGSTRNVVSVFLLVTSVSPELSRSTPFVRTAPVFAAERWTRQVLACV